MIYTIERSPELNCGYFEFQEKSWVIISNSVGSAALEDIKVSEGIRKAGLGTVLLFCAVSWAIDEGLTRLDGGIFAPEKNMKEQMTKWYNNREILINGTRLYGKLNHIFQACQSILDRYDICPEVVNS